MSAATVPTPLTNLIQGARVYLSPVNYIEFSISVASELTNYLKFRLDGGASSTPLQRDEIVLENVVVSVAKNEETKTDLSSPLNYRVTEISLRHCDLKLSDAQQLTERDACFALGKILFELFSEGNSNFLNEQNGDSISDLRIKKTGDIGSSDEQSDTSDTPGLRRSSSTEDDEDVAFKRALLSIYPQSEILTKSMKAKESLQSQLVPNSICSLISDLLDAEEGNSFTSDTAIVTLAEVQHDILQMKQYPQRFLKDQLCPISALERTTLMNQQSDILYGREDEMEVLMNMASRVTNHIHLQGTRGFSCEAAFITGAGGVASHS